MGEKLKNFVEKDQECKYIPVGTCCSICGKRLGFFNTGFWSINVQRYNRHLSDGVLCADCKENAERYIKTKSKWLSKELQALDEWKKFDARNMDFYSVSDIKMLMEQKERSDKEKILAYDNRASGLFEIYNSFGLQTTMYGVGIFRFRKINDKSVVFGIAEKSIFKKGDRVKVYVADLEYETTVLEAHRFDKVEAQGRKPDALFFQTLNANLAMDRKIKEHQQGWLILDIVWKYQLDGGRVVKIG